MKIIIPKIVVIGGPSGIRHAIYVVLIASLGWLTPKLLELGWKAAFQANGKHPTGAPIRANATPSACPGAEDTIPPIAGVLASGGALK